MTATKEKKYSFRGTEEELMLSLERSIEDVKNGEIMGHSEFMKELEKEFIYL